MLIPVRNGGPEFEICLKALRASSFRQWELIVIDDGSEDASPTLAQQYGATVLRSPSAGPAHARNQGAAAAQGRYLFFLDADCAVHPDTLRRAAMRLMADPAVDALFGSYDDSPAATNLISQYKNLQHHYVHQTSLENASTFWTGCGCLKRTCFLELGGFDALRYPRPSIEDIELGCRLKLRGGRILLAKEVQVKHLKRWTLWSWLEADIQARAIPWSRLLLESEAIAPDLNLQWRHRLSGVSVMAVPAALVVRATRPLTLLLFALLIVLNAGFYCFLWRKRGLRFMLTCLPLHWFYYLYSALTFGSITLTKMRSH